LLEDADVLVESLHPDEARTLGLSPDETRDRYPRLVHCSVTAFGRSGPWRHFRGHALQAGAAGGASVVIGEPGRPPLPLPCSQPDFRARNVVVPVTHPEAGEFALYRSPIGLSATPGHIDRAAPCLGEHNDHVFLDVLGLSAGEYEAFKSDGVIR